MSKIEHEPGKRSADGLPWQAQAPGVQRRWLACACLVGGLSVAAGAFGAHALEDHLSTRALEHWETASRYAMGHVAPLIGVSLLAGGAGPTAQWAQRAGWAFVIGVAVFSGSLALLALTGVSRLGMVTPLGGLSLLAGWAMLARAATKR